MKKFIIIILALLFFLSLSNSIKADSGSCTCKVGVPPGTITYTYPSALVDADNCSDNYFPKCGPWSCSSLASCQNTPPPPCACEPIPTDTTCGNLGQICCFGTTNGTPYCNPYTDSHPSKIMTSLGTDMSDCICISDEPSDLVFNLCNGLGDKEETCRKCLGSDEKNRGVWTAIGCIKTDPKAFIGDFLKIAIGVAGGISLLLMLYGAFLISISAGDPKKADEGKEVITGTIAGLLFIIFSIFLLKLIGVEILNIPGF